MKSFYDSFFSFSVSERSQIAKRSGLSLAYLLKHIYVNRKSPKFHLHNAVNLDRASGGALPFYQHTKGDVDWPYVLDRLREAKRRGDFVSSANNTKEVANDTLT